MSTLPESLGGFIEAFDKKRSAPNMPAINLDNMAFEGRLAKWLDEGRDIDDVFHPSSLADPCMRLDVVRLMLLDCKEKGIEPPAPLTEIGLDAADRDKANFDYHLQRKFDAGTALHEMEQRRYFDGTSGPRLIGRWRCSNCNIIVGERIPKPEPCRNTVIIENPDAPMRVTHVPFATRKCSEHGRWLYEEPRVRMPMPYGIEGRVDMAFAIGSTEFIVDIKTTGSDKFAKVRESGTPLPKDEAQVKIYLMAWPAEFGILRYIDQGAVDADPVHIVVNRDPIVEESVKHYILQVRDLASSGRWTVATPACAKSTYARAKRCPLNSICFKEER